MSLNGTWKFHWSGDPQRRPFVFESPSFNVSKWETIDVPCCVEMRGYGMPHYIAHGYPHKFEWPKILDKETGRHDYNPAMYYKRKFRLPDSWKGRETILRFEGAGSALYAWINGEKVGYAEDSKLPSEFNITPFLKDGENEIAVQVFRWCDGSYVEDQDMLRFSGLFRDVSLWSRPKTGIADFVVTQKFGEGYKSATVDVAVETYGDFGWEDIFLARHDGWQKHTLQIRRYAQPVAQRDVILNLDVRQTGLGGASVGPAPMEKYRFDSSKPVSWTLRISPENHAGR